MENSYYEIEIKKLEKVLDKKLKRDIIVLGLDCASRTGYATCKIDKKKVVIECGYIKIKSEDVVNKYNQFFEFIDTYFKDLRKKKVKKYVVIEDTYFFRNPNVLKFLSRLGMIAFCLCKFHSFNCEFVMPSQSRSFLGLKGIAKKEEIHKQFHEKFDIKLEDIDIVDAIILAIYGAIDKESNKII